MKTSPASFVPPGALALALVLLLASCASKNSKPDYLPSAGPAGSIGNLSDKAGQSQPKAAKPDQPTQILALIAHDASGKPVYVEIQQSSGDEALDERAMQHVFATMRFPAGKGDTVIVRLNPKSIPKP